ncbi:MAG: NAD(P)-dependent oxidoreductase [Gammaproteobacteria bacterium]|jgi:3-hydroxyisobutyrate dehydrogenase-like beta-hydroxyacid dehydrogenase
MAEIGFIGTGTIGGPIAGRLLGDADSLHVFDTRADATRALEAAGAHRASSVEDMAQTCTTIFLSLPGPPQIREVVSGDNGLLAHRGRIETIVDLSTNAIALNRELAAAAEAIGIQYLDAPVSGGKVAAIDGTLAVMVGGNNAAFEAVRPLIERFGKNIFYLGASGSGTLAKLVNNQIFLAASVLVQEGFVMGAKAGMDPADLIEVLKVSSAGALMRIAPLVLSRKFDLDVFALAIAAKDIAVAIESADALGVDVPMAKAASGIYEKAREQGLGGEDFYATVKVLEAAAGIVMPSLKKPAAKPA